MTAHRGGQRSSNRHGIDDDQMAGARTGVTAEAFTELQRLAQDLSFQSVERVLADLGNGPSGGVEAVRALRHWGAEYLRVADELEAAARRCRLAEREIGQRIDTLLMGWAERPRTPPAYEPSAQGIRRRNGRDGWFRKLLRRGRTGREEPAGTPVPTPRTRGATAVLSAASPRQQPVQAAAKADITALVLGPLELSVAGRRVLRWNSLRARAVFQYLLIHQDRPIRRDVLMGLEWPDHTRNSARNNLNVALYSLRNTLDDPGQDVQPVLYQDGCYSLNPALNWWIDRNEFFSTLQHAESARRAGRQRQAIAAYEKAADLYRGPLFEDDPAGEWFLAEQRHLAELYLQALEQLGSAYFELGNLPDAVRCGQLAVGTDPCCEPAHRLLMRCFGLQHQRQLVSRQYRSCVAALHDELGVSPGEETVQLFRDLTATV
jgi:DNA-binding SARP family transcriptional activator